MNSTEKAIERLNAPVIVSGSSHQQLTVTSTASTLATLGVTVPSVEFGGAVIQVNGGSVRYTISGTTPTTTFGFLAIDGQPMNLTTADFNLAKFIICTGSPKLEIQVIK